MNVASAPRTLSQEMQLTSSVMLWSKWNCPIDPPLSTLKGKGKRPEENTSTEHANMPQGGQFNNFASSQQMLVNTRFLWYKRSL